ncbi:MAG: PEPxxWA-CTERM sorting domain-containing protein [Alphaproteobacteria bacterium]|nr:PEPxxWA-CTERM sorting domain-containing protein [Alphaproteobacteria bacterium]MBU1517112.1 PEPxxWA-CTERM sorting domain-containing protein [Alphaproteobacteria bacterium]MBU2093731.1 PEPxxWA-CTERM sorting domain-containing protein [Alphaproteobacteria bacterium]MBU2153947.1 PEPxxWA-CTERM sorting domain-containing protein [Alphaproteobacteria bacterium]MBU2308669.1 PEPxxWA-CTERM sorting domain-containing protein [Alphaproteobacteria bacterium]
MAATTFAAGAANAALVFVGSWDVYDAGAPAWSEAGQTGPLAYTGQEAAALLFGGNAADYVISTAGNQVANVNFQAWYDVIGVGGSQFAQGYSAKYLGQYYGPTSDGYCCVNDDGLHAASAYVRDNLEGDNAINYAFREDGVAPVPEPASWALMISGFGMAGAMVRRRKAALA